MSETLNIVLNSASFCAAMLLCLQVVQKILKHIEESFGFSLPIGRYGETAIIVVFIFAWGVLCGREKTGKLIYNKKILAFGNTMTILSMPSYVLTSLAEWTESNFEKWIFVGIPAVWCITCLILLFYDPKRKNH